MTHRFAAPIAVLAVLAALSLSSTSCGGGGGPVSPPSTLPPTTPPTTLAPPPPVSSCPIGPGNPYASCDRTTPSLLAQVETAMDTLVQQRPQLFDLSEELVAGTRAYRVLDREGYLEGLVSTLRAAGLCAERDVDDPAQAQIFVKDSNTSSEEFDVLLGNGFMRRGGGSYRTTCVPAAFPVARTADDPPVGSGCYRPFPPEINRMNCKVHIPGADVTILDSTPIVLDPLYCAAVGYPDRPDCPIRHEGSIDRVACENWRAGVAADTGRPGPTWRKEDGSFCTGPASGCENGVSQYQLLVYRNGKYTVCAQTGRCCTVNVETF
jgi:hypothetical protein